MSFTDFFWLYCVTTITPFIERGEGWSLRSVGVLDQSQQECRFFRRNSNPLQTFQIQLTRETSSSSLGDRLEKRSIISSLNRKPAEFLCPGYFLGDARRARSRDGIRFKWYYVMPRGHKHDPIYSLSINAAFRANFSSFSRLKRL